MTVNYTVMHCNTLHYTVEYTAVQTTKQDLKGLHNHLLTRIDAKTGGKLTATIVRILVANLRSSAHMTLIHQ